MSELEQQLKDFEKKYGTKVARLGVHDDDPERLRTGIFAFDLVTGGGFPEGRCSIVYGPESSMKTTLCFKAIASAQKKYPDKKAVFVDIEGRLSRSWATSMGVNCEDLVYVLPDTAEMVVDVVESLLYASDVSIIVLDSLAAMLTTHELNSDAQKAMVGTTGIVINKLYRKVSRALTMGRREGHTPTIIMINQIRSKIVQMGNPETMPGGKAFQFAASLVVRVYGKDEILGEKAASEAGADDVMPAYKKVSFILKKWSIPVAAPNGVFLIALQSISNPPLKVGESYDWNTVVSYLKSLELLQQQKKGWGLVDPTTGELETFAKQEDIKQRMGQEAEFDAKIKSWIIQGVLSV